VALFDLIMVFAAEINAARESRGLYPLELDTRLSCAAQKRADEGEPCEHDQTAWDRAKACGTTATAEILACGHASPGAVIVDLGRSPANAAILYDSDRTAFGVGVANNYWVIMFR
jgi:uncharacterized protein YkwD